MENNEHGREIHKSLIGEKENIIIIPKKTTTVIITTIKQSGVARHEGNDMQRDKKKDLSSDRQYQEGMNGVRKKSRATQPQEGLVTPTHIKLQVKKDENTVGTKKWIYITFLSTEEDGGRGEGGGRQYESTFPSSPDSITAVLCKFGKRMIWEFLMRGDSCG